MENQLQIFSNPEFGTIRTILLDGEIWFVAADVCRALDIQNPRDTVAKVLTDNEKGVDTIYTPGGPQQMNIVNEPGLYHLIFVSRKPNAVKFQQWVYHEVLPSIRKHGYYVAPNATFDIDLILKLIPEINLTEDQINLLKTATPTLAAQTTAMITRILKKYEKKYGRYRACCLRFAGRNLEMAQRL